MRKYIPLVLFIFSWPVLCADIHGRVVRVLDGDTIEVMGVRPAGSAIPRSFANHALFRSFSFPL